jgi:hypothetical protein
MVISGLSSPPSEGLGEAFMKGRIAYDLGRMPDIQALSKSLE